MTPLPPRLTILALGLIASACSGTVSPLETPSGDVTVLERSEIVLTRIGEAATVSARAGARSTDRPALSPDSESRWIGAVPVLDAAALATGQLVAAGPGSATVRVEAFGASAAVLRVHVRPAAPAVLRVEGSTVGGGDTLVLRGYGLEGLASDAVTIGDAPGTLVGRDSATLRVVAPALSSVACASASPEPLRVRGASVPEGTRILRRHAREIALKVGEVRALSVADADCLRLAPLAGSRYALAFVDGRAVNAAESGIEGNPVPAGTFGVSVAEAGEIAPAAAMSSHGLRSLSAHASLASAARGSVAASPAAYGSRWAVGDRFEAADPALAAPVRLRVARVYGGHLALAIVEGEEIAGGEAAWLARADSAFGDAFAVGYPLLERVLSDRRPVTSRASGQLLVVAGRLESSALGMSATVRSASGPLSFLLLNTARSTTAGGMLRTVVHELAHAWQAEYAHATGGAGPAASWASEGTADLLAWTTVARARDIDPLGNEPWAPRIDDAQLAPYALFAANARGDLTAGYESAASFLLDLTGRLARRGMRFEEAAAIVTRGALEGWHGYDAAGGRRPGLISRMRAGLGQAWDPSAALLTWTLSQAADDLTGNPDLQNHAFQAVSTSGRGRGAGWIAPAALRTGERALREDPAATVSVTGNAATVTTRYGSANYVSIDDQGRGGAYTLRASAAGARLPAVRWMVVRYR